MEAPISDTNTKAYRKHVGNPHCNLCDARVTREDLDAMKQTKTERAFLTLVSQFAIVVQWGFAQKLGACVLCPNCNKQIEEHTETVTLRSELETYLKVIQSNAQTNLATEIGQQLRDCISEHWNSLVPKNLPAYYRHCF